MPPPTNSELNAKREEHCFAVTSDRKYYRVGGTFIKRSLRPSEWQKHNGYMYVPRFGTERILNEGACLQFLAANTNIPLPKLYACIEDDGAAYLITKYIEGVNMNDLDSEKKEIVAKELQGHMETLKELKSNVWGGPGGVVLPPYRIMRHSDGRPWRMQDRDSKDLVFCHNDLSANNIIVDPHTLKINAIIDWEYGGFYPAEFEWHFYQRQKSGPSVAQEGELDDEDVLKDIMSRERKG
ncbi:unnamed protein product [Clonostachys chloroleuca]|uniref:Aminoglycoside phosphotransferase domain-containing protein n=1 Tax=Clonostachys chloroleuca TaxID=1926264 RepID=A0AA35V9J5_9HYPO|nr:unnamed protein product [Clonostachys chloroleuca]